MRTGLVALVMAVGLAVGATACGSSAKPSAVVDRATVVTASKLQLTVWRDPGTGEIAFRLGRRPPVEILRDRDLIIVPDTLDHFGTPDAAWSFVERLYGVTRTAVEQALKRPVRVSRPAVMPMQLPKRFGTTNDHYATIAELRKAVDFLVPDPGARLNGLDRVDLQVVRSVPPADPGPTVRIWYSGPHQTAAVDVDAADSPEGRRIASGLKTDVGPRIRGPHFVANTGDDHYQFKCGDAYVDVGMYIRTIERWRVILTQVARDCPAG